MFKTNIRNNILVQRVIFGMKSGVRSSTLTPAETFTNSESISKDKILTEEFRSKLSCIREKNSNPGKLTLAEKQPVFTSTEVVNPDTNETNNHIFSKFTNIFDKLPDMEPPKILNSSLPTVEEDEKMLMKQQRNEDKGLESSVGNDETVHCSRLDSTVVKLGDSQNGAVEMQPKSEMSSVDWSSVVLPLGLHRNDGHLLTNELVQNLNRLYFETSERVELWYGLTLEKLLIWNKRLEAYLKEKK